MSYTICCPLACPCCLRNCGEQFHRSRQGLPRPTSHRSVHPASRPAVLSRQRSGLLYWTNSGSARTSRKHWLAFAGLCSSSRSFSTTDLRALHRTTATSLFGTSGASTLTALHDEGCWLCGMCELCHADMCGHCYPMKHRCPIEEQMTNDKYAAEQAAKDKADAKVNTLGLELVASRRRCNLCRQFGGSAKAIWQCLRCTGYPSDPGKDLVFFCNDHFKECKECGRWLCDRCLKEHPSECRPREKWQGASTGVCALCRQLGGSGAARWPCKECTGSPVTPGCDVRDFG